MTIPFLMVDDTKQRLVALRKLAEHPARRISWETLVAASKGFDPADPAKRPPSPTPLDQTIELPFGWKISLTIEQQRVGWCWHMSMSSPVAGRTPNPQVVDWVLTALDVSQTREMCEVYLEHYPQGRVAVNVIGLLEVVAPN